MDWQAFVFDPSEKWIEVFDRLAKDRFVMPSQAEAAVNEVLKRLSANGWQRLKRFSGKASPAGFLVATVRNLIEDIAREKFGRPRPPKWLVQLGGRWVSVFKRLCLERQPPESVARSLATDQSSIETLMEMARTIKSRIPSCGGPGVGEVQAGEELIELEAQQLAVREASAPMLDEQLLLALSAFTGGAEEGTWPSSIAADRFVALTQLSLSDDQALLLRLVFEENLSAAKAGARLNIPAFQARRNLKSILQRLRKAIGESP